MRAPSQRRRRPVSVALMVLAALWVSLFLWRKSFSYVAVSGVYIIEISVLLALASFAGFVLLRPTLSFSVPRDRRVWITVALAATFVCYNLVRALLSESVSAKALIPGIYPAYLVIAMIIAGNAPGSDLLRTGRLFSALFLLAPTVGYFNAYLVAPRFGTIESPGWTYVYGVTMAMGLFLIRNPLLAVPLFGVYFLVAVFVFQRGTFVAFAVAGLMLWLASTWRGKRSLMATMLIRGGLVAAVGILVAPFAFEMVSGSRYGRFLVTPENILKFLYSIVSTDVDLAGGVIGTRQHRLHMWAEIVKQIFSGIGTALFGFGFAGEVGDSVGVSFRAPHNGFVTLLYRGGVVGLLLFLGLLLAIFRMFSDAWKRAPSQSPVRWHAALGLIVLGAMIGDALAGTILDSPFTSMLFYVHVSIVGVFISRQVRAAPETYGGIRSGRNVPHPSG